MFIIYMFLDPYIYFSTTGLCYPSAPEYIVYVDSARILGSYLTVGTAATISGARTADFECGQSHPYFDCQLTTNSLQFRSTTGAPYLPHINSGIQIICIPYNCASSNTKRVYLDVFSKLYIMIISCPLIIPCMWLAITCLLIVGAIIRKANSFLLSDCMFSLVPLLHNYYFTLSLMHTQPSIILYYQARFTR